MLNFKTSLRWPRCQPIIVADLAPGRAYSVKRSPCGAAVGLYSTPVSVLFGGTPFRRGVGGGDTMSSEWISRRAVAVILGVRPSTVSAWEAGGLLDEMGITIRDMAGGRRQYREQDVRRVRGEMTITMSTIK